MTISLLILGFISHRLSLLYLNLIYLSVFIRYIRLRRIYRFNDSNSSSPAIAIINPSFFLSAYLALSLAFYLIFVLPIPQLVVVIKVLLFEIIHFLSVAFYAYLSHLQYTGNTINKYIIYSVHHKFLGFNMLFFQKNIELGISQVCKSLSRIFLLSMMYK